VVVEGCVPLARASCDHGGGLVDSPLKKSGQAVKRAEADLHKVGRSSLQEARNARIDTSGGNCQLAAGGRIAHFPSWRKGNSHSASDRTWESGMVGVIECC
jgi:hypothetical protein